MSGRTPAAEDARRRVLRALQKDLGHNFTDLALLDRALCHASTGNEGRSNYERLEFLGDAFLNFAVADHLFRQAPEIPEGKLTSARADIVSRKPLAAIARRLKLATMLEVGKGLRETELNSERILADLTEAVLGAIYLDSGVRAARAFVRRHIVPRTAAAEDPESRIDTKTRLLHWCQHHKLGQPRYELLRTLGLQHQQEFVVSVKLSDGRACEGRGRNKRSAEKQAAASMLVEVEQPRIARAGES